MGDPLSLAFFSSEVSPTHSTPQGDHFLVSLARKTFSIGILAAIPHIALKLGPILRMKLYEKRKKWKAHPSPHPTAFVYFHSPQVVFSPRIFVRVFSCN